MAPRRVAIPRRLIRTPTNEEETRAETEERPPPPAEVASENEQLLKALEAERLSFEQTVSNLRSQIRSVDQEWETQRLTHEQAVSKLRSRFNEYQTTIRSLATCTAARASTDGDDDDLRSRRRELEQSLRESEQSCATLRQATDAISREIQTLEFLISVVPFAGESIEDLALRQLRYRFARDVFEVQARFDSLGGDVEELEDELSLIECISLGLEKENRKLMTEIERGRRREAELKAAFRQISENQEIITDGISQSELAQLIRTKRRETTRELRAMRSEFERKIYALEPSREYLNAELAAKEEVTEILNGKVRDLFGEVEKIKTECANSLRRMRDKQKNEIQDIQVRHNLKKQDLLKQQKRMWQ
jgi:DNA repair exonuclease SbcCD ATPase subunit